MGHLLSFSGFQDFPCCTRIPTETDEVNSMFLFRVNLFVQHGLLMVALAEGDEGEAGASLILFIDQRSLGSAALSGLSTPWELSSLSLPGPQLPPSRCTSAWVVKVGWWKFATRRSAGCYLCPAQWSLPRECPHGSEDRLRVAEHLHGRRTGRGNQPFSVWS